MMRRPCAAAVVLSRARIRAVPSFFASRFFFTEHQHGTHFPVCLSSRTTGFQYRRDAGTSSHRRETIYGAVPSHLIVVVLNIKRAMRVLDSQWLVAAVAAPRAGFRRDEKRVVHDNETR